jgi:vacuolar iron transporter family protein
VTMSEVHRGGRAGWLRAAVLGANDGILSTAGLVVGVASAGTDQTTIAIAGVAGVVAGALSMAAGEYVSVSSQSDIDHSDLALEVLELAEDPEGELAELAGIYLDRGLSAELAMAVATELTAHDALGAHARDELGLAEHRRARPLQAAGTSAIAFFSGAVLPLAAIWLSPDAARVWITAAVTLIALGALGAVGAWLGGAPKGRAAFRVMLWGVLAMTATGLIGWAVGALLL